ncbi:methyl-accepting chemotaxis protein [Marispirochaeta aestuarii]|uniref:methyl-accepting chemotaxis protein n=1 Tax=Marispirochaeta aestuarii TaxID=1963862 RepID=UPI0029C758E3|nr:methyl-accepting chemotaxis protein [Marispirochaeta aestuarii]
MFKNMKMAMKMTVGFGSIILLIAVALTIILMNVKTIQTDSEALNREYVPEVRIANDVERNTLLYMYAMRGYGFTFQDSYWKEAAEAQRAVFKALDDAEILAEESVYLRKLSAGVTTAKTRLGEYRDLAEETNRVISGVTGERTVLDEAAAEFMGHCEDFLMGQSSKLSREIAAGAGSGALNERYRKISLINNIIELGNAIRISNFRGQLYIDPAIINGGVANFNTMDSLLSEIREITVEPQDLQELDDIKVAADTYKGGMQNILASYKRLAELNEGRIAAGNDALTAAQDTARAGLEGTAERTDRALSLVNLTFTIVVAGIILVILISVVIALALTRMITRALSQGVAFAGKIAQGDLDAQLDVYQRDEIGQLADALRDMLKSLQYKAEMIEYFAAGDFSRKVELASQKDGLGRSLETMRNSLNDLLGQVNVAIDQVTSGSEQVSQASQSLSQGATEQASSLEEISSSVNEVNGQSQQNAKNALEANALAKQATENAENGNSQMKGLITAMDEINASSDEIKKIVKIIDDIAFQINLLALNANVEAARAGKYGRGFAVVAEEVRNLAARAAEAVKETTVSVDKTVESIESGNHAAEATASQLEEIVGGVGKVATFLEEIAQASREQAQAVSQVTEGLDQIDQVTQANTASAEESASAAEELASQAQHLQQMIAQFTLEARTVRQLEAPKAQSYHGSGGRSSHKPVSRQSAAKRNYNDSYEVEETGIKPVDPSEVIKLDDDDFDRF